MRLEQRRSRIEVAMPALGMVSLVVDVTSFTEKGFIGTSSFSGKAVSIEFDDGDKGVFLNHEMAERLSVKKGSALSVVVEDDNTQMMRMTVSGVGATIRISSARLYFAVGKEGGAIIKIQKG